MSDTSIGFAAPQGTSAWRDALSIPTVSEEYGIPVETLRWWRKQGNGPRSFTIGGGVRYLREDIEAWFQAQYDQAVSGAS